MEMSILNILNINIESIFLKLFNMSIAASWLILVVVILRIILKKAPKAFRCFWWALVAVRLICPFSFESVLSLIPSAETVPQDIMYMQEPAIHSGVYALNSTLNPVLAESLAPTVGDSVNPLQVVTFVATIIWIVGLITMMIYATFSYFRVHRKVCASIKLKENMYLCDYIDTPFILGTIKPKIYIPSALEEDKMAYVIAHEKAHLKRHDHWWKLLGYTLLCVYWFNPIVWLAYILLCRDIELACDESVIKKLGEADKKPYSEALLFCSVPRKMIVACPLAFGEVGVKERVETVLNYKKPAFWVIMVAVIVCAVVAVCFLTNPKESQNASPEQLERADYVTLTVETSEDSVQYMLAGNYVSSDCLYMNPLSSSLTGSDSGKIYQFVEDALIIKDRLTGMEQRIIPQEWEWQEFPYTDEEWNALLGPVIERFQETQHISEQYEEIRYLRLSGNYCLLWVDGSLWFVQMNKNPQMGEYIWSIYSLVPEGSMGSAEWEYQPMFSSQYPAFPIQFTFEDVEVVAYCTNGALIDYDNDGSEYPQGTRLTIPTSSKLYWSPRIYEDEILRFASETEIGFYIMQKDGMILYSGTIYITRDDNINTSGIFTARLVGGDMIMSQNTLMPGAVVAPIAEQK